MRLNLYDVFMSPLESLWLKRVRNLLLKHAKGRVLELGFGTGVNYKYYIQSRLDELIATDLAKNYDNLPEVNFITSSADKLPFDDNSMDTVVGTLVLCSVEDIQKALDEVYRVLKPNGKYIFIEHIRPDNFLAGSFDTVNDKLWYKISKSCRINKQTLIAIKDKRWRVKYNVMGEILCYGIAIKPSNLH